MEYLFTFWTCFLLYLEYDKVASMRLEFLASQGRRAEKFTVLVRNVPQVSGRSISDSVDYYFKKNHPSTYLCHQIVYRCRLKAYTCSDYMIAFVREFFTAQLRRKFIKSFLQGFLPSLALKIFLYYLPGTAFQQLHAFLHQLPSQYISHQS